MTDVAGKEYLAMQYGADPTGAVSSRAAIQAAINTRAENGRRPVLSLPRGTFLLDGPLQIPTSGLILRCAGPATVLSQAFAIPTNSELGVFMIADAANGAEGIVLEEFAVLCPPVEGTSPNLSAWAQAIYFAGATDVTVRGLELQNGTMTFRPLASLVGTVDVNTDGNNVGVTVTDCTVTDAAEGLAFVQGSELTVKGCRFINAYDSSLSINSSGEKIVIVGNIFDKQGNVWNALAHVELTNDGSGDSRGIRDVTISGNHMLNSSNTRGVQAQNVSHLAVTANTIRNNAGAGIWIEDGSQIVAVAANVVDVPSDGDPGIQIVNDGTGCADVSVSGNTVVSTAAANPALYAGGGSATVSGISIVGNLLHNPTNPSASLDADVTNGIFAYNNGAGSGAAPSIAGTGWTSTGNLT